MICFPRTGVCRQLERARTAPAAAATRLQNLSELNQPHGKEGGERESAPRPPPAPQARQPGPAPHRESPRILCGGGSRPLSKMDTRPALPVSAATAAPTAAASWGLGVGERRLPSPRPRATRKLGA